MKKNVLIVFAALTCLTAQNAMADSQARLVKLQDGQVSRCNDATDKLQVPGAKNVLVELIQQDSTARTHNTTLKISAVTCTDAHWMIDENPTVEKYTAENGEKVEVIYSDYEVLVEDNDARSRKAAVALKDLEKNGTENISMEFAKDQRSLQNLEVIVRAKKTVRASGEVISESAQTFGSFALRISQ
ncbi:MAG: hypothetical protein AAGB31_00480 [Bdellovibrio sp.]